MLLLPIFTAEVLSEEPILKWYKDAHLAKGKSVFLEQMKKFVEWLKNAEEGNQQLSSYVDRVHFGNPNAIMLCSGVEGVNCPSETSVPPPLVLARKACQDNPCGSSSSCCVGCRAAAELGAGG